MAIPLHLWLKDEKGAEIRGSSHVVDFADSRTQVVSRQ
jgi:hypothetical protein